jgi:tetratricopeptide (TPR) repeat protein
MLLLNGGCATLSKQTVAEPGRTLSAAEKRKVQEHIYAAEDAMANNHLSIPNDGSALSLYQQALRLDPKNAQAKRGVEVIIEHYVALALKAATRDDTASARRLLNRGRDIDPTHPSIGPTEQFLQNVDTSHREIVTLRGLSEAKLRATINALVKGIPPSCRFGIHAANDASARRLYQLLRESFLHHDLNRRPRAASSISTPERLERICPYENT